MKSQVRYRSFRQNGVCKKNDAVTIAIPVKAWVGCYKLNRVKTQKCVSDDEPCLLLSVIVGTLLKKSVLFLLSEYNVFERTVFAALFRTGSAMLCSVKQAPYGFEKQNLFPYLVYLSPTGHTPKIGLYALSRKKYASTM
jgi:hypothetical protein